MRDLPAVDLFSDEIIAALGAGEKTILASGDWPVAAIAFEGRHILLVRDHRHALTLSMPVQQSWHVMTRLDWHAATSDIKTAVTAYRETHPQSVSLADAIVALRLSEWLPQFPGTPVPGEVWLKKETEPQLSIGIFQSDDAARIVVWVGSEMRSCIVSTPDRLGILSSWIEPQIADQREAERLAAIEKARREALPLPDISDVMARLEAGEKISTGGGRYFETYFVAGGQLRREIFDEGYRETFDATRKELQTSIEYHPNRFRKEP